MKKLKVICTAIVALVMSITAVGCGEKNNNKTPADILIFDTAPASVYYLGDGINDFTLKYTADGLRSQIIDGCASDVTVSGFDSDTVGEREIKVSYKGIELSHSYTVKAAPDGMAISENIVDYTGLKTFMSDFEAVEMVLNVIVDLTVPEGETINIGANKTLLIASGVTLQNNGTIMCEGNIYGKVRGNLPLKSVVGYKKAFNMGDNQFSYRSAFAVDSPYELAWLAYANNTNATVKSELSPNGFAANGFHNCILELSSSLDISAYEWTPLGTSERPFRGSIFGNGFSIVGLNVNQTDADFSGFVGCMTDEAAYNYYNGYQVETSIAFKKVSVKGSGSVGVAAGYFISGAWIEPHVDNVTVSFAEIEGGQYIGGLVGRTEMRSSTEVSIRMFENVFSGTIKTSADTIAVGGLVGYAKGGLSVEGFDLNSTVSGKEALKIGGLVGWEVGVNYTGNNRYCSVNIDANGLAECSMTFNNLAITDDIGHTGE